MFVLVAIYLSATTDTQGSGVYIIFSSTDLLKILIACKCSTCMHVEDIFINLWLYTKVEKEKKKINDLY